MSFQYQLKRTNRLELFNFALTGVFLLLYAPILLHWLDGWLKKSISIEHEYFSHGIIGIPFAAYLVWSYRKQWERLPNIAHPLGSILLVVGGIFYLSGTAEKEEIQWMGESIGKHIDS